MADNAQRLLVTGASGGLAQLVIRNLLDVHGVAPERIIAVTRSPEKLAHFAARGVAVRKGDFDAPEALTEAFAGAGRLLLISVGADPLQSYLNDIDPIGDPNRRRVVCQIGAGRAAEQAGVRHILRAKSRAANRLLLEARSLVYRGGDPREPHELVDSAHVGISRLSSDL